MIVNSQRFGSHEFSEEELILFPQGLVGFPNDDSFVLLVPEGDSRVAWLQSVRSPALSLPVVSLHVIAVEAPTAAIARALRVTQIAETLEECAVLVVMTTRPGIGSTVNLLAPILINAATRRGVQALLEIDPAALETPLKLRPKEGSVEKSGTQEPAEESKSAP